jgi:hypothetical protein
MAQKFGNGRWVKEGFFDNRVPGTVVGRITLAVIGPVDVLLKGDCRGEIAGKAFAFRNPAFSDDDLAAHVLADFEVPHVGEVSLISFDPHPHLTPHPYIEWFSTRKNHYRIELGAGEARVLTDAEALALDPDVQAIRQALSGSLAPTRDEADQDWF